jgi:hypothetical protein
VSSSIRRLFDKMLSLPGAQRLSIVSCTSLGSRPASRVIDQLMAGVWACAAGAANIRAALKMSLRMLAFLLEGHGRKTALIVQSSEIGPLPPPPLELVRPGAGAGGGAGGRFFATRSFAGGAAAEAGVIADASNATAPAMNATRMGEGDLPSTFTRTSGHGSG